VHAFSDGNKRTAAFVMDWTLSANGYEATPSPDAVSTVILLTATGRITIDGLRMALVHWCGLEISDHSL
jgi:death on curing protein